MTDYSDPRETVRDTLTISTHAKAAAAVAAVRMGVTVAAVSVADQGDGTWYGELRHAPCDKHTDLLVQLAGCHAQQKFQPEFVDDPDLDRAMAELSEAQRKVAFWQALNQVLSDWPTIKRVAAALSARGKLTGAELLALVMGQKPAGMVQ